MIMKLGMDDEAVSTRQFSRHETGCTEQNEDSDSYNGFVDALEYMPRECAL